MNVPFDRQTNLDEEEESGADTAFEEFLTREGLQLLRSYRLIESGNLRTSISDLVDAIRVALADRGSISGLHAVANDERLEPQSRLESSLSILRMAKRGIQYPGALTVDETQTVCHALVLHYAQMGIGGVG